MKLDVLVVAAHPDDAEISAGGTILRLVDAGHAVGVLDVTRGEMGTRGDRAMRDAEAARATELMGLAWRGNLEQPDGRVRPSTEARERLAAHLRELQPDVVLGHHTLDLHPDHVASGHLTNEAWYLAGLRRLADDAGGPPARRPRRLAHFLSHTAFQPTFVVDVGAVWERKVELIRAYASQLQPSDEADRGKHFLFGADILARVETKARYWGESIGVRYGEPLLCDGPVAFEDPLVQLLGGRSR